MKRSSPTRASTIATMFGLALSLVLIPASRGQEGQQQESKPQSASDKDDNRKPEDASKPAEPEKVPEPPKPTGLLQAKLLPGIGAVNHSITTALPECQQFYSQGLGF